MALRKAAAYSKKRVVPFTRVSKKRQKSYIKAVPQQKIVKFEMGDTNAYKQGKLPYRLTVKVTEDIQIRHNALEASRQFINKKLDKQLSGQFYFKVVPFPHHVQRENKMLTGAGADRMQTGMQQSYGKAVGKAALLNKGSDLFIIAVKDFNAARFARKTINKIKPKLPCDIKIIEEDLNKKKE